MRERPIPFSAPMVRAILAGTKTQTRRVAKFSPLSPGLNFGFSALHADQFGWAWALVSRGAGGCWNERTKPLRCPYGKPGDRLWVREAWRTVAEADGLPPRDLTPADRIWYEADAPHQPGAGKLRPGMFMPRWASRITLEVTGVRVDRLGQCSEADAIAEGVERTVTGDGWRRYADAKSEAAGLPPCATAVDSYRSLWESINGPGSWSANPWVWCVSFRRITP